MGNYDMHGNVWEWCLDWHANDITALNGAVNAVSGTTRVRRGGGWNSAAGDCRAAFRRDDSPTSRGINLGFRVVCTAGLQ